jgi:beta-lactamase regulating signal transducer with metallopeptidase domain
MNAFEPLLAGPLVPALGWTLLHFLWQGALVAALAAAARMVLREASASARYLAGCTALALLLLLPAATFGWLWFAGQAAEPAAAMAEPEAAMESAAGWAAPAGLGDLAPAAGLPLRQRAAEALQPALPWLVGGWLAGVLLLSLRLVGGWTVALQLRRRWIQPVAPALQATLERLRLRLRVSRPVLLLQSACVQVPTVVGVLRPAILLPLSALCGLSPEQLETILAHELAHIRRHDFLVNLLQSLVETLLFYHPAVWWVSAWVRIEREHCCDDVAVAVCGDPLSYAHALTDLESWRSGAPQLAVAASGGELLARIRRLLGKPAPDAYPSVWPLAGLILLLVSAASATALLLRPEAVAQEQASAAEPAAPAGSWSRILKGGQVLEFEQGRRISIEGVGRLHIDTKERLIKLPAEMDLSLGGKRVDERCVPREADVLESRDPTGQSYWKIRLEPDRPEQPKPEPNVFGGMSLELESPTVLSLQFLPPYGAVFRSQPVPSRVVLGVVMDEVKGETAERLGVDPGDAQLITDLPEGMPAQRAGLRRGDVIVEIDGRRPASMSKLGAALARRSPGEVMILGVWRDGRLASFPVSLGDRQVLGPALDAFFRARETPTPAP